MGFLGRGPGLCRKPGARESLVCVRDSEHSLAGTLRDGEEGGGVKPGSGANGEGWGQRLIEDLRGVLRTLYLNVRAAGL